MRLIMSEHTLTVEFDRDVSYLLDMKYDGDDSFDLHFTKNERVVLSEHGKFIRQYLF